MPLSGSYGALHVRGGRTGEIAYFVDGLAATNRMYNAPTIEPIPEAVESVELHVGPYSAEFGQGLSGLSLARLRSGGEHLEISAEYRTDGFASAGEKFLWSTTSGFRSAVATIGGPIPIADTLRFFAAWRHYSRQNRQVMFLDPFRYDNLTEDRYGMQGRPLPGPLAFDENTLPDNGIQEDVLQGNVRLALEDVSLRLTGAYRASAAPVGSTWPDALYWHYDLDRLPEGRERAALLGLSALTSSPSTSIQIKASWQFSSFDTFDPLFGNAWQLYSDSAANAASGRFNFRSRWRGPNPYSIIYFFPIANDDAPWTRYRKEEQHSWTIAAELRQKFGEGLTLHTGLSLEWWTMRFYEIGNIPNVQELLYGSHGEQVRYFPSEAARRASMARAGDIDNYGYTIDGEEAGSGNDEPRTPFFAAGFAQLEYATEELSVEVGLRVEHMALGMPVPKSTANIPFDPMADAIDESQLVDQSPRDFLLPRIDVAYTVLPGMRIRGAYGQYVGMPPLIQVFHGTPLLNETVSPTSRGLSYHTPVGWEAQPERSTQTEVGIRYSFMSGGTAGVTAYLKKNSDLQAIRKVQTDPSSPPLSNAIVNDAYTDVRGLEIDLSLHHESGIYADLRYALSSATGTDAYVLSALGEVERWIPLPPRAAIPLDYDRTHRGTAILGYASPLRKDDQLLTGIDLSLIFMYAGGHPYTRELPLATWGATSTPWNVGVNYLLDPRFSSPAEPLNSSRTSGTLTIDLAMSKELAIGPITATLYVHVLNLINTRSAVNVYSRTGAPDDDGWLDSWLAETYKQVPGYADFYRSINLSNRWAYMSTTNTDMYNSPRQVRVGLIIKL